ncbi:hypothetical protein SAMN05216262_11742 [Colwellia chukchiensis]|uniref:Uncharacterized protein n=1 Tax=Colwellia chukchiensis TaxID=641665 RepID=A0A1H7S5M0_9GAMM|nr:hypothetical protein [Colwellia chukchiensis]SEL67930.1 hypothetical protein SAMN05216262_11742 [Colwellia chukchiensis]
MQTLKSTRSWSALLTYCLVTFYIGSSTSLAKEYIIGVENIDYFPLYNFSPQALEQKSFTQELLTTFFSQQGYSFKFIALPLKRFDKWYLEDAIDFKFPDNRRWRSAQTSKLDINYSQPVLHLMAGSYVLKKKSKFTSPRTKTPWHNLRLFSNALV